MQLESCEERIEVLLVGGARHSLRDRTLNSFKAMHFSPPPPCRGKNLPSSYDIFTGSTIHTQHLTIQGFKRHPSILLFSLLTLYREEKTLLPQKERFPIECFLSSSKTCMLWLLFHRHEYETYTPKRPIFVTFAW